MPRRLTREKTYIRLPEEQIRRIESLADSWSYETKAFIRSRLNQYRPLSPFVSGIKVLFSVLFLFAKKKKR